MAEQEDNDPESQTEDATPKKLEGLREKGTVPKSAELTAVVSLMVGLAVLFARLGANSGALRDVATSCFSLSDHARPMSALAMAGDGFARVVLPVSLASLAAALGAGLLQTRGYVSLSQLGRNIEQLDPIAGLGRAFPGKDTFVEVGKMLLKVTVVGVVVFGVVHAALPRLTLLSRRPTMAAIDEVRNVSGTLFVRGIGALVVLAILDFVLASRRFAKEARMSKKEVSGRPVRKAPASAIRRLR